MLERDVEAHLVKLVKQMGGRAYKFVSPGNSGVPDRLVVLPGGRVVFVELKAPGQKPRPLQEMQIARLRGLGCRVEVCDSYESVEEVLKRC